MEIYGCDINLTGSLRQREEIEVFCFFGHELKLNFTSLPYDDWLSTSRLVFYGETAAGHNPSVYIKCLKHVLSAYTDMEEKPPLIVNTMGFPEGIATAP